MSINETSSAATIEETDYQAIFEAMPGSFIVVKPNEPYFTVIAISDELLKLTTTKREEIIGNSIFVAYPENPQASVATGPSSLRISLQNALKYKQPDHMPVIRYDVKNTAGTFEERYWKASCKPMLNKDGEVLYIIASTADITVAVEAEKARNILSEIEKINQLFMQAPVAICMVKGPDYIVELANDGMLQFLGRTSAMMNKPLIESLPEARLQGVIAILDNIRKTGEPFYVSAFSAAIVINGVREQRYFNLVFKPYYDDPAVTEVSHIFCVANNVTEEVLARKKLEESEQNLRNIILKAPIAMNIFRGPSFVVELANDRMFDVWGKPAKDILGKPFFETLPEAKDFGFEKLLKHVYTTGETVNIEEGQVHFPRNGKIETVYITVVYAPFRGGDGAISGIIAVAVDVTGQVIERKKIEVAEARARLAVESADQGTFEINLLTNEIFASLRMAALYDVEPDAGWEEYISALYPEDLNARRAAYNLANQTGRLTYEARVTHKDRSLHWIRVNGKVFFDKQNTPVNILGVVQDITFEKEMERHKDDFISIVSHELKTPITSLKAYAQILTRKYSLLQDKESTGMLHKMNDQVNRLNYIVQDLLDVSRIEGNRIMFRIVEFDFSELLAQTVEEVQRTTETHRIIIEKNENILVHADKERTSQVLINLLTNAISYSPAGSPIFVNTYCNKDEIICTVKDVGSGIEKEKQTRIFERFYRATDVNRYNGGLGLGLYISAEIIKRQNGRIWVESEPGKGATFYFTVPLKQ